MNLHALSKIEYSAMQPTELRTIRQRLHLTQAGLAARLGVAGPTVNRWERGTRKIPVPVEQFCIEWIEVTNERTRTHRHTHDAALSPV